MKSNLNELVAKAYNQAQNAMEYIRSQDHAEFTDENDNIVYKVPLKSKELTFFLVNVTLEPLWFLSVGIKSLEVLGLLKNDYPWSINIFDLDVITRVITSPSIFVHYSQKRLDPKRIEVYMASDELDLFQLYLYVGNFYPPDPDRQKIKLVLGGFSGNFDNHFLFGGRLPQLNIEPDWLKLINDIESSRPPRHSRMTSALLDLDHDNRKIIINNFRKIARKAVKGKNSHNFLSIEPDGDTGFSFVCVYKDKDLDYLLFKGSEECMKEYNKRVWIGIGRDVTQKEKFATAFYYSESHDMIQEKSETTSQ